MLERIPQLLANGFDSTIIVLMERKSPNKQKSEWCLGFSMPNLLLPGHFEFGDLAIVNGLDERVEAIANENHAARVLMNGFIYKLNPECRPSAMIFKREHHFSDLWGAMVDARNICAVLASCYGWIKSIGQLNRHVYRDTDHFDFFPLRPRVDGKYLDCIGPEVNSSMVARDEFKGFTHPYLFVHPCLRLEIDDWMFSVFCKVWSRIHISGKGTRSDRRLMRALSVAYEACKVPLGMENFLHDHGRHCALWVSAFESLAHPGPGKMVGYKNVVELIGRRVLSDSKMSRKVRMKVGVKNKKSVFLALNTSQRLYIQLYRARNAFLHGNRLSLDTFIPQNLGSGIRLLDTAPVIFHAALEAYVNESAGCAGRSRWNGLEDALTQSHWSVEDELKRCGEL